VTHDSYREFIQRELDGDLSDEETARLDRHTAGCAECRRERQEYHQLAQGLMSMKAVMPERSFVSQMEFDFDELLRPQSQPTPLQKKGLRRIPTGWWQGLSVAAAVVLAIGFTYNFLPGSPAVQTAEPGNAAHTPAPVVALGDAPSAQPGSQQANGGNQPTGTKPSAEPQGGSPAAGSSSGPAAGGVNSSTLTTQGPSHATSAGTAAGNGAGSGNGTVSGSGAGVGNGYGTGTGGSAGFGSGSGSGNGTGSGNGSGSGNGTGSGNGSGSGYGTGSGNGSGSGYGTGSGNGSGSGSGTGSGSVTVADSGTVSSEKPAAGGSLHGSGTVASIGPSQDHGQGIASLKDRDRFYGQTAGALAAEQPPLPMIVGTINHAPSAINEALQEQVRNGNTAVRWSTIPAQVVQHVLTEIGFAGIAAVHETTHPDRVDVVQGGQTYRVRLTQPFDTGVNGIWQPVQISRELSMTSQEPTDKPILEYFRQMSQEGQFTIASLYVEENLFMNRTVVGADLILSTDNGPLQVYIPYTFRLKLNSDYSWSLDGKPTVRH
jgi:hypothetical protein